jgi:hypothetical protein
VNASKASFLAKPTWVISRAPRRAESSALVVGVAHALLELAHLDQQRLLSSVPIPTGVAGIASVKLAKAILHRCDLRLGRAEIGVELLLAG